MSVAGLIVTYQRPRLLRECLDRILSAQIKPQFLVVLDNASADETKHVLQEVQSRSSVPLIVVRSDKNLGGAGGFHLGLSWIRNNLEVDWVWLMDDDTWVQNTSLEALVAAANFFPEAAFLCSDVRWTNGDPCLMNVPTLQHPWNSSLAGKGYFAVTSASFVSLMVSVSAVRKVGLPVSDFFIWLDDIEYTRRLSKVGPGYCVLNSSVVHATPINSAPDYSMISLENSWKYWFGLRNEVALQLRSSQSLTWLRCFAILWKRLAEARRGRASFWIQCRLFQAWLAGWLFRYDELAELSLDRCEIQKPTSFSVG